MKATLVEKLLAYGATDGPLLKEVTYVKVCGREETRFAFLVRPSCCKPLLVGSLSVLGKDREVALAYGAFHRVQASSSAAAPRMRRTTIMSPDVLG
jgi:hypothetical protein